MLFDMYQKRMIARVSKINNTIIQKVEELFLGFTLGTQLNWNNHSEHNYF